MIEKNTLKIAHVFDLFVFIHLCVVYQHVRLTVLLTYSVVLFYMLYYSLPSRKRTTSSDH